MTDPKTTISEFVGLNQATQMVVIYGALLELKIEIEMIKQIQLAMSGIALNKEKGREAR